MTIPRNDPRAQRIIAEANRILARDPRSSAERGIARHLDKIERDLEEIRNAVSALKKRRQMPTASQGAPYHTRDCGAV